MAKERRSLFDRIFKPKEILKPMTTFESLTAYQPVFRKGYSSIYENESVRSAIETLSKHAGKLKIEIKGSPRPEFTTLRNRPNDFQTWEQFLRRTYTILLMQNTCFICPILNWEGKTTGYFPVLPTRCEVAEYNNILYLRYQFMNGDRGAIEFDKVGILTRFQYDDDFFGSTNNALISTMDLISINNQGIQEGVKNSATYRFMAKMTNFAKAEDLKKERERFSKDNFSGENGGMLLFPNTYSDIRQIDSKPFTIDSEQLKVIQNNICNYFGVSENVLQNKAYGDEMNAFYEGAIEPFAIQLSEVMTKLTFTNREINQGSQIIFTPNRLQYMSAKEKLSVSANLLDRGVLSLNEVREMWNLPPIENGDDHIIRGEYYNIDDKINNIDSEDEQPSDNNQEGENENAN